MNHTDGSIHNLTPTPGTAHLTINNDPHKSYTLPIIGFAVVTTWHDDEQAETQLQTVVLIENKYPTTINTHLNDNPDTQLVRIELDH